MRIAHRVSVSSSSPVVAAELTLLGVDVAAGGPVTFVVFEDDERWPALQRWMQGRKVLDIVSTEFSAAEIGAAAWLAMVGDWHHGYPQPEDDFGYRAVTYEPGAYCDACGSRARQVAPFRMKGEPKWGRRGILQLNWVFDEYFVRPEVWSAVFEPIGVGCRPVTNRRGVELATVVQLDMVAEVDVVTDGLDGEPCGRCGRTRYLPVVRGPSPALAFEPAAPVARSRQWFGSGARAYRLVVVAQDVRRALDAAKVRGASFRPVAR